MIEKQLKLCRQLARQVGHCLTVLTETRCWCAALQIEACQTHATALLEDQPDNEDAAIMLAELMAHQVGLEQELQLRSLCMPFPTQRETLLLLWLPTCHALDHLLLCPPPV